MNAPPIPRALAPEPTGLNDDGTSIRWMDWAQASAGKPGHHGTDNHATSTETLPQEQAHVGFLISCFITTLFCPGSVEPLRVLHQRWRVQEKTMDHLVYVSEFSAFRNMALSTSTG